VTTTTGVSGTEQTEEKAEEIKRDHYYMPLDSVPDPDELERIPDPDEIEGKLGE
jgi:hypothetical protein